MTKSAVKSYVRKARKLASQYGNSAAGKTSPAKRKAVRQMTRQLTVAQKRAEAKASRGRSAPSARKIAAKRGK